MAAVLLSFPVLCGISIAGSWIAWRIGGKTPARAAVVAQAIFAMLPAPHVLAAVCFALFFTLGTPMTPTMHETRYQ